jgi:hypothetical protein
VVTVAMLGYLGGFARLRIVTTGVDSFMARSRAEIEGLPMDVGGWHGERIPLEGQAIQLLQPNAERRILYRTVLPQVGQTRAVYSVIQASDSRFMTGHAPMNCYPNSGYQTVEQHECVWRVGEIKDVRGMEYTFRRQRPDGQWDVTNVRNFFIFPDGHFGASLKELEEAAQDYRRLKYGVAQVQLLTAGVGLTDKQRDDIFSDLVGSQKSLEMIRVLRTGMSQHE